MTAAAGPLRGKAIPLQGSLRSAYAAYEHQWLLYLRTWRGSIFGSFAQPVLFLVAMGIGLGGFVDASGSGAIDVPYIQFLAPALLVSTVMQGSTFEATFPVLGGFRWNRRYHAMYATPLSPYAIAFGQIAWIATRATIVATIFCGVIIAFGAAGSPGIIWTIPVGTLTALAFAGPIAAYMTTQRDTTAFNAIWRFGITPLFLFSRNVLPDRVPARAGPLDRLARCRCGTASTSRAPCRSGPSATRRWCRSPTS